MQDVAGRGRFRDAIARSPVYQLAQQLEDGAARLSDCGSGDMEFSALHDLNDEADMRHLDVEYWPTATAVH